MISIWNGYKTISVDNGEKETVAITTSQRREIEELTGKDIKKLSNEKVRSQLRFINAENYYD